MSWTYGFEGGGECKHSGCKRLWEGRGFAHFSLMQEVVVLTLCFCLFVFCLLYYSLGFPPRLDIWSKKRKCHSRKFYFPLGGNHSLGTEVEGQRSVVEDHTEAFVSLHLSFSGCPLGEGVVKYILSVAPPYTNLLCKGATISNWSGFIASEHLLTTHAAGNRELGEIWCLPLKSSWSVKQ